MEFKYVFLLLRLQTDVSQGRDAIMSRFKGIMPIGMKYNVAELAPGFIFFIGRTPTGAVLDSVLNDHLDRIDRVSSNPLKYAKIPPLDVIVLTDGVPSVLISLIAKLGSCFIFL